MFKKVFLITLIPITAFAWSPSSFKKPTDSELKKKLNEFLLIVLFCYRFMFWFFHHIPESHHTELFNALLNSFLRIHFL